MELVGIEFLHSLFVTSQLVQQGNLLKYEVIPLGYQLRVLLQEIQALLVRLVQTLIELVEFHQNTAISLVEVESLLHILYSLILLTFLVELCQSKVTPHGREVGIEFGRGFPVLNSQVVLTLVIIQTTQIVRDLGILNEREGAQIVKHIGIFQTVGEAIVWFGMTGLFDVTEQFSGIFTIYSQIIIGKR